MDKLIRLVFGLIAGAIAAAMLYALFFGTGAKRSDWFGGSTHNNNLANDVVDNGGTIKNTTENGEAIVGDRNGFEGAWFYAALAMENPISHYYYNYCYVPEVLNDYYIDQALGINYTVDLTDLNDAINRVPANLNTDEIVTDDEINNADGRNDTIAAYTTGWY